MTSYPDPDSVLYAVLPLTGATLFILISRIPGAKHGFLGAETARLRALVPAAEGI